MAELTMEGSSLIVGPRAPDARSSRERIATAPDERTLATRSNRVLGSPVTAWAVLLLGVLLRGYAAVRFPFDQDELYTLAESRDLFHTTLAPGIDSRPLYYLLQHPLLSVFSASPISLRILPFVFGALGLWITWLAGRRHFGAVGGVVTAMIISLSPWHLYASSMARYYSLVYLCAALVVLWLPRAYESNRPREYLSVLIVFLVGTLTHPSFVIAMVGLVAGLSLVREDGTLGVRWPTANAWRCLWGPYAIALLAEFVLLRLVGRSGAMANLGTRGVAAAIRLIPAMIDWMTLPVFIAALCGAVAFAVRANRQRAIGVMAITAVAATFLLLIVASMRTGVYADYGIGMLPLLVLCVAGLAHGLDAAADRSAGALVVLTLVIGSGAPSIVSFLSDGLRFDYRSAYAEVARREPNVAVLGWPEALRKYYGGSLRGYEFRPDTAYLDRVLRREPGGVWAVVSAKRFGIVEDDAGQGALWLSSRCRFELSFAHPRFDYRVYRVDLYRCQGARDSSSAVR